MPKEALVRSSRKKRDPNGERYAAHLDRQSVRPSERINMAFADKTVESMLRPMIPVDTPFLYRIFMKTVQRVPLHYTSLNSSSAFILVCDEDREAVGWYGSECRLEDRKYATELGLQVLRLDLRKPSATHFPFNSEAQENFRILRYILPKLWCDEATYRAKKAADARKKPIFNSPVSIGCLDKYLDGTFGLREVAFVATDANGAVPRLAFIPVELKTIAVLNYAEQWDVWIARGVTAAEEKIALDYIMKLAASRSTSGALVSAITTVAKNSNIRITRQGCERVLFREHLKVLTDFEPVGRTVPWTAPMPGSSAGLLGLSSLDAISDSVNSLGRFGGDLSGVVGGVTGMALEGMAGVFNFSSAGDGSKQRLETNKTGQAGGGGGSSSNEANLAVSAAELKNNGVSAAAGVGTGTGGKDEGTARPATASKLSFSRFFGSGSSSSGAAGGKATAAGASQVGDDTSTAPERPAPPPNKVSSNSKSVFAGRDMLSLEMMDLIDSLSVGQAKSNTIIETVAFEPLILVGYQIEVDEGPYAGRYVVTGVKKTVFGKSLFRLSNFEIEDDWVKLKRGTQAGIPFRVLRRVFDPN